MRQGQQHRRGRSRGSSGGNGSHGSHNHRKGQNPLSRSFESNGPDVKVRGTAADVASKYMALARDAQTSGDPVLAENYLQHAEHYNRMIIAYREQQMQQGGGDMANGNGHRMRPVNEFGEHGDEGDGETIVDPGMAEQPPMPGITRQPHQEGQPRQENGRHDGRPQDDRRDDRRQDDRRPQHNNRPDHRGEHRQDRGDNPRFRDRRFDRGDRGDRGGDRQQDRGDRPARQDRPERSERHDRMDPRPERPEYRAEQPEVIQDERPVRAPAVLDQPQPAVEAMEPAARQPAPSRRRERFDMMKDQPEFLRRPVRRPRRDDAAAGEGDDAPAAAGEPQEKPGS